MKGEIEIEFGGLAPPILDQLREQGVKASVLSSVDALNLQKDADAILRLAVRGILPSAEVHKARKRLFNRMAREISAIVREQRKRV